MIFGHKKKYTAAVIAAGGVSSRMGQDKLFAELAGSTVLARTLAVFEASREIDEIVVVAHSDELERVALIAQPFGKVVLVVRGGATRAQSVYNGVFAVSKRADIIAIHDGARPLVTGKIIADTVRAAEKFQAATPAVAVKATIKVARRGIVTETPDRDTLFEVQTPQVFDADLIKGALTVARDKKAAPTDDCAAVEALGVAVHLTDGSYENIKLTTPEDLMLAEAILSGRLQKGE